MDVKRKPYNETNIGNLTVPSDWKVVKLGDNATLKNGANFSTKDVGNGRLMVNVKDLYDFRPFVKTVYETRVEKIADSYILMDGDILFVRSSLVREGVGFSAMYRDNGEETVYSGFIIRARIKSDNIFNPFVAYYLRSGLGRKKIVSLAGTVTITNIGQDALAMLPIPIPPLPEQQKIAEILSTVDEQINTTQAIIDKSKELKKGLMQRFFLNKAYMIMSLGETEQTELKPIRLKELGIIYTGTTPRTAIAEYYDSEDYMFVGPSDLGNKKYLSKSKKYISSKGFEVARKLPQKSLMVTCIGTIGKLAICEKPCATNQQVNSIVPHEEYSVDYLYYILQGIQPYLSGFSADTTIPQLNKSDFGKVVTFIHKSKTERDKISEILSEADAKIEKEENEKAKLEELKKGLMQQLLTGKKRVKV